MIGILWVLNMHYKGKHLRDSFGQNSVDVIHQKISYQLIIYKMSKYQLSDRQQQNYAV